HVDKHFVLGGEPAFDDSDAFLDPLVVGVHDLGQVVVGDHVIRLGTSEAHNTAGCGTLRQRHAVAGAHACAPARESRSVGFFSAVVLVTVPLSWRRTRPVSVPAGGNSMVSETPSD